MIYIGTLLLCLYLTWMYDVLGYTKNKWRWYYLLMIWFIAISGFQYMVGTDMKNYLNHYDSYYNTLRFDVGDMEGRLQPGWILLSYCCRQLTNDFLLFKLIHATFVNVAVFSFFKRETKYVFVCVLLYAFTSYLIINFNILRQSFAMGFILYSISYYKRKRYILASFFIFIAFLFHNSAIIALLLPLFKIIRYNKFNFLILSCVGLFGIFVLTTIDLDTLIPFIFESGLMGDNIAELGQHHLANEKFESREIQIGITRFAQVLLLLPILFYYIKKKQDFYFGGMGFVYLILIILNYSIPILFRFRLYYDMAFYIIFATVIIEIPKARFRQIGKVVFIVLLTLFLYFPYREYAYKYPSSNYRYIDQYYPYHSVFFPVFDRKKQSFFDNQ